MSSIHSIRDRLVVVVLLVLVLSGCSTLPLAPPTAEERALPPAEAGTIAETASLLEQSLPAGDSAFLLVPGNEEALNWRLALVDSARSSIDAQYFIWKDDQASTLLLEHVLAAADRGVRVRLLVDDMFLSTGGVFSAADGPIAALNLHPKIEVRLFNPGKYRNGILGLAGNFGSTLKEYNRRMHNKLLIADGHLAIAGGRNIGNEYFGLYESYNFLDLDVLLGGTVVGQAADAFDDYWNSDLAYPGSALKEVSEADYRQIRALNQDYMSENADLLHAYPAGTTDWSQRLEALPHSMHPGYGVFLQDRPVRRGEDEFRLYDMLDRLIEPGGREAIIVTPYLIPVGNFLEAIESDATAGTKISILTSSLGSNDETAAHSHYKKFRRDILATGAELFEFRAEPEPEIRRHADVAPQRAEFVSLHLKAAAYDRRRCIIGSLNVDPRSIEKNTENGIYIESPSLCGELSDYLASLLIPENAWRVDQDDKGRLEWTSAEGTVTRQPARGFGQRVADFFYRLLPIESQL